MIGVLGEAGKRFHLALEEPLVFGAHVIPRSNLLRTRSKFGVSGDHSHFLLAGKGLLVQLVPAANKLSFVFLDPFFRRMVRGMRSAGCEVHVERLVGTEG